MQLIAFGTFIGVLTLFLGLYWLFILRDEDQSKAHLSKRLRAAIGRASARNVGVIAKVEQHVSNIGVLQRLLSGAAFTGPIERLIEQADSRLTVGLFLLMSGTSARAGYLLVTMLSGYRGIGFVALAAGTGHTSSPGAGLRHHASEHVEGAGQGLGGVGEALV